VIRIGIVGAENSHSAAIAKTLNIGKKVPGCRATVIWGETDKFAKDAAKAGAIPKIVKRTTDMIGEIDAVIIDHRHAKYHLSAAEPFLKARLPMFIDKPFCYRLAEGKKFLARCRRAKVPVTSFGAMPMQRCFAHFRRDANRGGAVRAVSSIGPCDLDSPYGGIFFYGIHQVEMLVEAFGTDVSAVSVARAGKGKDAAATLFFRSGLVATMHCLTGGATGFQITATKDTGPLGRKIISDADSYLTGIRTFYKMFKTGKEPLDHKRILAPVAILEAMEKSVKTGKVTPVVKV
ncbi:MAG: Gfo/Idh/MocA family oxidoreductase, partial [Phycisphaerae bacterium]|nr:Gfo/Idh/MocA family oxidoreductase [Phycisphaerae bacterium]